MDGLIDRRTVYTIPNQFIEIAREGQQNGRTPDVESCKVTKRF